MAKETTKYRVRDNRSVNRSSKLVPDVSFTPVES